MKTPISVIIAFGLCAFLEAGSLDRSFPPEGWEDHGVKDGVSLSSKRVDGLDLLSVRGATVIDASPETIVGM